MNLKVLFLILTYWTIIGIFFATGGALWIDEGVTATYDLNSTQIGASEQDQGGFFTTGVAMGRFARITLLGIGLPTTIPLIVRIVFAAWQTSWTIFTVGFVISSIWNG